MLITVKMNNQYTKQNFPTSNELNKNLYQYNFNELLNNIFYKIVASYNILPVPNVNQLTGLYPNVNQLAGSVPNVNQLAGSVPNVNQLTGPYPNVIHFIRMISTELNNYTPQLIDDVKQFLIEKGYKITEIEDINSNIIGWKLVW